VDLPPFPGGLAGHALEGRQEHRPRLYLQQEAFSRFIHGRHQSSYSGNGAERPPAQLQPKKDGFLSDDNDRAGREILDLFDNS
jgi:hypothetical protein